MSAQSSNRPLVKNQFDEILAADLGSIQVAIPTSSTTLEKVIFSVRLQVPHRNYDTEGWLLHNKQIVAPLKNLHVEPIVDPKLSLHPIRRIGPAVPLHFEVETTNPLPEVVARLAAFTCQFQGNLRPYTAIFRNMAPQFSQVYPFAGVDTVVSVIADMQEKEAEFVRKNSEYLRESSFYRKRFHL